MPKKRNLSINVSLSSNKTHQTFNWFHTLFSYYLFHDYRLKLKCSSFLNSSSYGLDDIP